MTAVFATATVATAALGLEIVLYEPVSKIGGAAIFSRNPQLFTTPPSGVELLDDDDVALVDDDDVALIDDGVG